MARQPIVLQPPPAERKVVLLRKGKAAKMIGSWAAGIFGVMLLLAAIALVGILPDEDKPLPQYEVTFTEQRSEIPGETITLAEGLSADFAIDYTGESLFGMAISFEWQDDIAASLPDSFHVSLEHPNGTVVFGPKELTNAQPTAGEQAGTYIAARESRVISFNLAPRPSTEILSAETHDEPIASVEARAKSLEGDPAGAWTLTITLTTAGDCPAPESLDSMRAIVCRTEATDGIDAGNEIKIIGVDFIEYYTTVTPL
jgi:hypothetical protein